MTAYMPLPVTIEADHFRHRSSADFFANWTQLGPVNGDGVFEGGNLLVGPVTVNVTGLGLLPLANTIRAQRYGAVAEAMRLPSHAA